MVMDLGAATMTCAQVANEFAPTDLAVNHLGESIEEVSAGVRDSAHHQIFLVEFR